MGRCIEIAYISDEFTTSQSEQKQQKLGWYQVDVLSTVHQVLKPSLQPGFCFWWSWEAVNSFKIYANYASYESHTCGGQPMYADNFYIGLNQMIFLLITIVVHDRKSDQKNPFESHFSGSDWGLRSSGQEWKIERNFVVSIRSLPRRLILFYHGNFNTVIYCFPWSLGLGCSLDTWICTEMPNVCVRMCNSAFASVLCKFRIHSGWIGRRIWNVQILFPKNGKVSGISMLTKSGLEMWSRDRNKDLWTTMLITY